jgi:hypothetical protein
MATLHAKNDANLEFGHDAIPMSRLVRFGTVFTEAYHSEEVAQYVYGDPKSCLNVVLFNCKLGFLTEN